MRKISLILFTLYVFIGAACSEDYLETKPTDKISAKVALSTSENMMLILNGLHRMMYSQNPLPDASWNRSGQSYFLPSLDRIGGILISSAPSGGWGRSDLQWQEHTQAYSALNRNFWYQRYHFVNTANSIINAVSEGEFTLDENMNNVLGQAHAYRAWAYHQLIMTYAKGYIIGNPTSDPGVPLRLSSKSPYNSGPRAKVDEVYNQIEIDINMAIEYLQNASAPDDKSHISLNAAYGIKARISLSKGDWLEAASAAQNARDAYPLLTQEEWLSGFNTLDLSEIIWGGHVIDEETNYYSSYFYFVSSVFNGSYCRAVQKLINQEVYNKLSLTDYRRQAWLPWAPNTNPGAANGQGGSYLADPNYDDETDFWNAYDSIVNIYGMTTGHHTHPYMNVKFLQKNPGTIDPDDVIYMRSAEMYLIEAEALAMMNNISGAQVALAVFGKARDSAYDETIFTTQSLLMDQIKFQRHVELWGEGFSFHDYIRWDEALDHSNSGASEILYQNGFYQDKASINPRWVWKIPQDEIDNNPYLTESDQNQY